MYILFCALFSTAAAAKFMTLVCDNNYDLLDGTYTPSFTIVYNDGERRLYWCVTNEVLHRVVSDIKSTHTIRAIKYLHDELSGLGWGEAKAVVDTLADVKCVDTTVETVVQVKTLRFW